MAMSKCRTRLSLSPNPDRHSVSLPVGSSWSFCAKRSKTNGLCEPSSIRMFAVVEVQSEVTMDTAVFSKTGPDAKVCAECRTYVWLFFALVAGRSSLCYAAISHSHKLVWYLREHVLHLNLDLQSVTLWVPRKLKHRRFSVFLLQYFRGSGMFRRKRTSERSGN
jgi:hypothetical protein